MIIKRIAFAEQQSRISTRLKNGYTLVELLFAIAIITILLALISPTLFRIRNGADSVVCSNNLRQIGSALLLYAADNDGELPGPFYTEAPPAIARWPPNNLGTKLSPYLGPYGRPPSPPYSALFSSWCFYYDVFNCPAARRIVLGQTKILDGYTAYIIIRSPGQQFFSGYPGINPPMRLVNIDKPSTYPALSDVDQRNYPMAGVAIAATPSHVSYRNVLYLDGHVERSPYP